MLALFLVAMLAATESPPAQQFGTRPAPLLIRGATLFKAPTVPVVQPLAAGQFLRADSTPPRLTNPSTFTDFLPYGIELNDLYQRYRSTGRWQNGFGLTFALGEKKHRWTFVLGPIQFTFGGYRDPPLR